MASAHTAPLRLGAKEVITPVEALKATRLVRVKVPPGLTPAGVLTELNEPQVALNEAIVQKARELTAGIESLMDKTRVIGRFAQRIKYVSIQTGIGRGGGYKPHSASEVLQKAYGDCKDKANVMRALLKAVGIESYPVSIYSGDRSYVRPEFASPQQFNHAIVAIRVDDAVKVPAVAEHPHLGRLLLFDPTDEYTEFGYLPAHEQDSYALVVAGPQGSLLKTPSTPPSFNRTERTAHVQLSGNGSVAANIKEISFGESSFEYRRLLRMQARSDFDRGIERWVNRTARGALMQKIEAAEGDGEFRLNLEFSSAAYGQSMRGRLLVFRPAVVAHRAPVSASNKTRKHPIVLDPEAYHETVTVSLPEGFEIDEMPDEIRLSGPIGSFSAIWQQEGRQLVFTRSLDVHASAIPAEQYSDVREFFGQVYAAEQAPVVLARK